MHGHWVLTQLGERREDLQNPRRVLVLKLIQKRPVVQCAGVWCVPALLVAWARGGGTGIDEVPDAVANSAEFSRGLAVTVENSKGSAGEAGTARRDSAVIAIGRQDVQQDCEERCAAVVDDVDGRVAGIVGAGCEGAAQVFREEADVGVATTSHDASCCAFLVPNDYDRGEGREGHSLVVCLARLERTRKQKEPGCLRGMRQRVTLLETSSTAAAQEVVPVAASLFLCGLCRDVEWLTRGSYVGCSFAVSACGAAAMEAALPPALYV